MRRDRGGLHRAGGAHRGTRRTTFVIDLIASRTIVAGVSPSGQVTAGWPYRSDAAHQGTVSCPAGKDCHGYTLATPTIGRGNVLYLLNSAASPSVGGSIVAVDPDGREHSGWPVELTRPGAAFWAAVAGADGTAYALAIEPESGNTSSASILAIASDSTVLWTRTIIDP